MRNMRQETQPNLHLLQIVTISVRAALSVSIKLVLRDRSLGAEHDECPYAVPRLPRQSLTRIHRKGILPCRKLVKRPKAPPIP